MIKPTEHLILWAILILVSLFGMISERKKWFGKLAGVLVTILSMAVLSSLSIVPSASNPEVVVPVYQVIMGYILPVAIVLLLFNANLKMIFKKSGRLLTVYLIGTIGVVIGALLAFFIVNLGEEGFKIAGIFTATLIGGSVNFMATAEAFDFTTSKLFAASLAVDNFIVSLFIFILFFIPSISFLSRFYPTDNEERRSKVTDEMSTKGGHGMEEIALVLGIATSICFVGFWVDPFVANLTGITLKFNILIITLLTVILANIFSSQFSRLIEIANNLGMFFMYLFLAVIGAACNPTDILSEGPKILIYCMIVLIVHLLFMLLMSKVLKFSLKEMVIASAANIGGPTIAAPLAASLGASKLITPSILVGVLGYVIGTGVGISIGLMVK